MNPANWPERVWLNILAVGIPAVFFIALRTTAYGLIWIGEIL